MKDIHFWFISIGYVFLAINVVISASRYKTSSLPFKWFTFFLITGLVIQIVAMYFWYKELNNLPLLHIYTLFEFIFLSLFYRSIFKPINLKYFDHFIALISLFIIINSIFFQPFTGFNNNAKSITQLIYIGYAIIYFFRLPDKENYLLNLLNAAIIVYYSSSLFIFMFTNVLTDLKELIPYYNYLWLANAFLYLIFQLIILYGLWKTVYRQMKYSP